MAQTTATTSETKSFEVLAVTGNTLDVRLPEGTREITVPNDFRFTVDGQQLSVHQLKAGMKGTATITTRTTATPVTVTEVKNGTVMVRSGAGIIVRTDDGVKIVREGQPVQLSQLREGDKLSAVIITAMPPKVMTEQEVNATLAARPASGGSAASAPASASAAPARSAAPVGTSARANNSAASAPSSSAATLPKTASSRPLIGLLSGLLLTVGIALTVRRRLLS